MATRYATTVYNRLERVKGKVRSIYSQAIAFRQTCDHVTTKMGEVWMSPDFRKLPAYERGYVRGMAEELRNDVWRNHVVWMLGPMSGPTRQANTAWTEEMSELSRTPGALYGGHFWIDDEGNPTDKEWTEYKATN